MKRILIVEDDVLSQKVMMRNFKGKFEIDFCESSEEYYEKYQNTDYDIIIMDVAIKGSKSGLELIKDIKAKKEIPVLCLTAHAQTKMRRTAMESGSDLFLTKPVSNNVLREAVYSLLK